MTSSKAPKRSGFWLLVLLVLLVLLPLSAYWLSPLWVPALLTRLVHGQGFELHQLQLRRPGWNRWQIDQATVVRDEMRIELRNASFSFQWRLLLAGQLQRVTVGELKARITAGAAADDQQPAVRTVLRELPEPPLPRYWLQRLPWQVLEIRSLVLALPKYALTITGRAQQALTELTLEARVVSEQPALSRNLRIAHSADDVLSVRLLAAEGDATALELSARFDAKTVHYALNSVLQEQDTALVLSLLRYPTLDAHVELDLKGQLPWPLPQTFELQDLALDGRYQLNVRDLDNSLAPASDFSALSLSDFGGAFALAAGTLKADVNNGALSFSQPGTAGIGRCTVARPLQLIATQADLTVHEGLSCLLQGERGSIDLELLGLNYQWPGPERVRTPATLALKFAYAAAIDQVDAKGDLQLQVTMDTASTVTGSGLLHLRADRLVQPGPAGSPVALPFTVLFQPDDNQGELRFHHDLQLSDRLLAAVSEGESKGMDLGGARLSYEGYLRWRPNGLIADVSGQFSNLEVHPPTDPSAATLHLQPLAGTLKLTLADSVLNLIGELRPENLKLPFSASYDLKHDRGSATMAIAATVAPSTLDGLFRNWSKTYAITGGQLAGELSLAFAAWAPVRMISSLRLKEGILNYEDYRLFDVGTALSLQWLPGRLLVSSDSVRAQRFDLGFPITDLETAVAYESTSGSSRLRFDDFRAQLLDGTATSSGFQIDLEVPAGNFAVQLSGISLTELVALEGNEVSGTGTLDGRLPIELSEKGVLVRGGELVSRPPGGVIRLSERFAAPTGEPGLDFALTALSDFTYDSLEASVNYSPDGELALGVRLQGRNPKVEAGRQINYNVNVTENIPALLESLKADRLITDEIERRLNR